MDELVFYSKPGCCLCDHSLPVVEALAQRHGLGLRKVNIEDDPRLMQLHGERIPVLALGDQELGWGRLSERALERKLSRR